MKKTSLSNKLAKSVAVILETTLHISANSTSSVFIHQPKVPAELEQFKRFK